MEELNKAGGHMVDVLLQESDNDGWGVIHHAAYHGRDGAMRALLESCVDARQAKAPIKNFPFYTALHLAASGGHYAAVHVMLDFINEVEPHGLLPFVTQKDQTKRTARDHAEKANHRSVEALLREAEHLDPRALSPCESLDGMALREIAPEEVPPPHTRIGAGAFGEVSRAELKATGRVVAVKKFVEQMDECQGLPEKQALLLTVKKEAQVLQQIQHPNIVAFVGAHLVPNSQLMVVMEYCTRGSLREELHGVRARRAAKGNVPVPFRLDLARQIAAGLCYMHHCGLVHRDIKPDNVLITEGYVAKIADFGLARVLRGTRANHSATGPGIGTDWYMAPEQWGTMKLTSKVDVYAFGVLLNEMLTNVGPEKAFDLEPYDYDLRKAVVDWNLRPEPVADGEAVAALIRSCWQGNAEERPSMSAVHRELKRLLKDSCA